MRDFRGRVAVVTGAASGIGQALAVELAGRGCELALVDIDAEKLRATASRIDALGRRATSHEVDVADKAAMRALPGAVARAHGRVDILVNNAGVSVAADFEEHSLEDFEWLVGVNFWGMVYGCKFFLPLLRASDDAYIVNLSSVFGLVGVPGQSSYCSTKFAVRGFSEALGAELAGSPIRVLSVHPGAIRTNIARATRWSAGRLDGREGTIAFFERHGMPPRKAAAKIVAAMRANRSRVLIAPETHAADLLERIFPAFTSTLVGRAQALLMKR